MKQAAAWDAIRGEDGILRLVLDLPGEKVNKLTEAVLAAFRKLLQTIREDSDLRGVIIRSGKPGTFIAGADVGEIQAITERDELEAKARIGQEIFQHLRVLPVPVVAAIHGACMGGGTEMALACTYRVASDDPATRIGLPEVRLGIVPGWGGTQRLPRLVGLRAALDLILTGRELRASTALRTGLIDAVVPAEHLEREAVRIITERPPPRPAPAGPAEWFFRNFPPARTLVFSVAEKNLRKKLHGDYPAPYRAVKLLRETYGGRLEPGLRREAAAVADLAVTPTARNLMALFDLNARARRDPGIADGTEPRPIRRATVVGAGVMGAGIALAITGRGTPVRIKDIGVEPISRGLREAYRILSRRVRRRRMTPRELRTRMAMIQPSLDYRGMRQMDLVVEAVFEDLELKRRLIREIEANVSAECLLVTNTSSLPVEGIARVAEHPERILGMHFFNPVHRMPLVEIIAADKTAPWATATAVALTKEIGKVPVVVRDRPGFLVNRLLMAYLAEVLELLEEGAEIGRLDRALEEFGMPMGPVRLLDQVGLDIASRVAEVLGKAFGRGVPAGAILDRLAAAGRLGVKGSRGFYLYRNGQPIADPSVEELIRPRGRIHPGEEEIRMRTLLPMLNEAARCLQEGVARRPGDVDLAMVLGTGFPPFRGGLLRYADSLGIDRVVSRLDVLASRFGTRMAPADLLKEMEKRGRKFFG